MAFKISKTTRRILIGAGAIALFFAYAWLPLATSGIWNSPDETAAAFFVDRVPALTGEYGVGAPYSDALGGLVSPRSMKVVGGMLVPGMWLGLPWILTVFERATGADIESLEILIAVFSVLAVFAWKGIVRRFFKDEKIAWFAAMALALHPAWWYFTARGLHPNVLFVSFLIFGLYAWYVAAAYVPPKRAELWRSIMVFLGGLSFGLAIFVRTNEAIWIVPLLLFVAWVAKKRPFKEHLLGVLGVAIPLALMLNVNVAVYGSPFVNGYSVQGEAAPVAFEAGEVVESVGFENPILSALFPFGIHEMNVVQNFVDYQLLFLALWSAFAVCGLVLLGLSWTKMPKSRRRVVKRVFWVCVIVSAYLAVLYGSWNISDNPDPNAVTIGTSYLRYWLPISVVSTALIGYALARGISSTRSNLYKGLTMGFWIAAFLAVSIMDVNYGKDEGLLKVYNNLQNYSVEREQLLDLVSTDSIVITDMADKILFPDRTVIVPLRSEATYAALSRAVEATDSKASSLYYYGITLPDEDIEHLRTIRLEPQGLGIELVKTIEGRSLYKIYEVLD